MTDPAEILDFWFAPDVVEMHWKKDAAFDDRIRARFGELHAAAARGTARELMGLTVAAVRHRQSQKCPHLGRGTGVTPRRKTPKWLRPCVLPAPTTGGWGCLARRLRSDGLEPDL